MVPLLARVWSRSSHRTLVQVLRRQCRKSCAAHDHVDFIFWHYEWKLGLERRRRNLRWRGCKRVMDERGGRCRRRCCQTQFQRRLEWRRRRRKQFWGWWRRRLVKKPAAAVIYRRLIFSPSLNPETTSM